MTASGRTQALVTLAVGDIRGYGRASHRSSHARGGRCLGATRLRGTCNSVLLEEVAIFLIFLAAVALAACGHDERSASDERAAARLTWLPSAASRASSSSSGLLCLLLPETVALWGTYADSLNRERSRKILALFPAHDPWSGRIAGAILIVTGIVLLFAALGGE